MESEFESDDRSTLHSEVGRLGSLGPASGPAAVPPPPPEPPGRPKLAPLRLDTAAVNCTAEQPASVGCLGGGAMGELPSDVGGHQGAAFPCGAPVTRKQVLRLTCRPPIFLRFVCHWQNYSVNHSNQVSAPQPNCQRDPSPAAEQHSFFPQNILFGLACGSAMQQQPLPRLWCCISPSA